MPNIRVEDDHSLATALEEAISTEGNTMASVDDVARQFAI